MSLDPNSTASWRGFLDLLRPPPGYRLGAALGTTFGLSFDALVAALLAMLDADAETLAHDPVSSLIAITKLAPNVRVLLHPGTIQGATDGLSPKLIGILDRILVPVAVKDGLFHPKAWVLRFERLGPASDAPDLMRVLVASRNLVRSTSIEMGFSMDGVRGAEPSPFCRELAAAVQAWLKSGKTRKSAVDALPRFLEQVTLDLPREASEDLRFRWQGPGSRAIVQHLPERLGAAIVVSPFLRPDFLRLIFERTTSIRVISTREELSALDDSIFSLIEERGQNQKHGALFAVDDLCGKDEQALEEDRIESVHAKVLIASGGDREVTFLGSANATGPGWGMVGSNAEAMVELSPGIGVDPFSKAFLFDGKKGLKPWVKAFTRSDRQQPSQEELAEQKLIRTLRHIGSVELEIDYEAPTRTLQVSLACGKSLPGTRDQSRQLVVEIVPLARQNTAQDWRSFSDLARGPLRFHDIDLAEVSAFVAIRVKEGQLERTCIALATLNLQEALLDARDAEARKDVLAHARPEDILRALVLGLVHLQQAGAGHTIIGNSSPRSISEILGAVTLEQTLRAVALEPDLVRQLRLLLGPRGDTTFQQFCDDLEAASEATRGRLE